MSRIFNQNSLNCYKMHTLKLHIILITLATIAVSRSYRSGYFRQPKFNTDNGYSQVSKLMNAFEKGERDSESERLNGLIAALELRAKKLKYPTYFKRGGESEMVRKLIKLGNDQRFSVDNYIASLLRRLQPW